MIKTMTIPSLSLGVLLSIVNTAASAGSASYYLDQNNAGLAPDNYIQVTISDSLAVVGDIDFSIQTLSAFSSLNPGSNFGMQSFHFNFDTLALSITSSSIIDINPEAWKISLFSNSSVSQYGRFDISTTGNGSSRTDLLSFTISGVAGDTIDSYASIFSDVPSGNMTPQLFAAHVGGFDSNGVSSAFFAGSALAVPVPPAAWLLGSGRLMLAGLVKRRK